MISELVVLLTGGDLDEDEVQEFTAYIEGAAENPEFDWIEDPQDALLWGLFDQLDEFIATSDKIDELHEQLSDLFADPLEPFPYEQYQEENWHSGHYFAWLDAQLAKRSPERGGYELLVMDNGFDDNMRAIVVNRPDVARVLELAGQHELTIVRATQFIPV